MKFVPMVKQMVTEHNPQVNNQADAQKTANEGFQEKEASRLSEPLSLFLIKMKEVLKKKETEYRLPEVSGFRMARLVCLALILSSCSFNLSPTTAQREQKKFERFKIAPKEALIYSGTAFLSYGVGKHFADLKLKY